MKKDQSQSAMKLQLWSSIILGKQKCLHATLVIALMTSKIRRARLTASIGRSLKEQNFYLSAP